MATTEESKTTAAFTGTVLVTGATGNIGKALVNALAAAYPSATIKAGTRNTDSDKAKALAAISGVTVVKASDEASVTQEAKGADVVVIVPPGSEDRATLSVTAVKAAAAAGATNLVVYSVSTDGDFLFARQFKELEAGVRAVSDTAVFLKLPFFTDNMWANAGTIKTMGKFFAPVPVDTPITQVTVGDAGEAGAAVVGAFDKYAGQSFKLVSNRATNAEFATAFSAALGKEVTAVQVPPEAAKKSMLDLGFPEWQVDGILELYAIINSSDAAVRSTVNYESEDVATLLGRPGTTVEQWVSAVKGGFA